VLRHFGTIEILRAYNLFQQMRTDDVPILLLELCKICLFDHLGIELQFFFIGLSNQSEALNVSFADGAQGLKSVEQRGLLAAYTALLFKASNSIRHVSNY
jgi:hypothetical protein